MRVALTLLERDVLPDFLIRFGIRRLLARRRAEILAGGEAAIDARENALIAELGESPIALATAEANQQHYEVPAAFYRHVLGPHLKYSSGYWPTGRETLEQSELAMLELTAERARVEDGQQILELGCGWGSLTLYLAARFPQARILGVSNSASQRRFILERAAERGLANIEIATADMNDFSTERRFDRVISIEMFEHMRNYRLLLARIAGWMKNDGKLFVHVFCHRRASYPFEARDDSDWMARYFFTGGLMPSADLLTRFDHDLRVCERWMVDGDHYRRTSAGWRERMDDQRAAISPILAGIYGTAEARRWWVYWRVFFMACEELFGFDGGREWQVAHYLFARRRACLA